MDAKSFLDEYYALCVKHGLRLNAALQVQSINSSASVTAVLQVVELEVPFKQGESHETEQSGR